MELTGYCRIIRNKDQKYVDYAQYIDNPISTIRHIFST